MHPVPEEEVMIGRGGKRPGSGRKPAKSPRITLGVDLPEPTHAAIDAARREMKCTWPALITWMAREVGILPPDGESDET
jgi:hypothetical protein